MNMSWIITFYNDQVKNHLLEWSGKLRAKLARILNLVTGYGGNLGMPLTRTLGEGLFEIRVIAGNESGRIFFAYVRRQEIMVLHSFVKKTQSTPDKELRLARRRLKEILSYE